MTNLGSSAEEGGGGKAILLQRGGYSEMDVCLMFVLPLLLVPLTDRLGD